MIYILKFLIWSLCLVVLPLVVSLTTMGGLVVAGSICGGLSLGSLVWFMAPYFGQRVRFIVAYGLMSWLSLMGFFIACVQQMWWLSYAVSIIIVLTRIFFFFWSGKTAPPMIHVRRSVAYSLQEFVDAGRDVTLAGLGGIPPRQPQVQQVQQPQAQNGAARPVAPARVGDLRSFPHNVSPMSGMSHFHKSTFRIPLTVVNGIVRYEKKRFFVCAELVQALLTRAQGVIRSPDWYWAEVQKISPVNIPFEMDRNIRIESAAAAVFEAQHEAQLFERLVRVGEDKQRDWSVFYRLAFTLVLTCVAMVPIRLVRLFVQVANVLVAISPATLSPRFQPARY
jgi:hypothetical protein